MITKKFILSSLALAAMMFAGTSCSSEEVAPATGESTVTLSVTLPDGIQSRAFGDGTTAQKLTMLVLDGETALPVFDGGATVLKTDINLATQVNVRLAAGKTYTVVCWAAAEGAPYTFDTANFTVSADYTGAKTDDEKFDAFYAAQDIKVTGNTTETVKLYRPFAQLNIGTNDLAEAKATGFEAETVSVTVPTYKSLNLLTGAVEEGDPTKVAFAANALPTGEAFPKAGYDYLSMNYLLMSADKQLVDLEFTVTAKDGATRTIPVTAVPVQRNYRTNIYGSMLTNSVNVNVEIVPEFERYAYIPYVSMLNAGISVKLEEDLVLDEAMRIYIPEGTTVTFDLNGHTISNEKSLWNEDDSGEYGTQTFALISCRGKGTLVLKGNGTLKPKDGDLFAVDVQSGKLIIEDGTYYGGHGGVALYVLNGVAYVKGGEFIPQKVSYAEYQPDHKWDHLIDYNWSDRELGEAVVTGGKFHRFNPASNWARWNYVSGMVPDGYAVNKSVVDDHDVYEVVKE